MQIMIPTIGTILTLRVPWTFVLVQEYRNQKFANESLRLGWEGSAGWSNEPKTKEVTLPAGTQLKVARIYIRSSSKEFREFDSVTFIIVQPTGRAVKGALKGRFFAKLADVNTMDVQIEGRSLPKRDETEMGCGLKYSPPGD